MNSIIQAEPLGKGKVGIGGETDDIQFGKRRVLSFALLDEVGEAERSLG